MKILEDELRKYADGGADEQSEAIFPFNGIELRFAKLLAGGKMTLEKYLTLRREYIARNRFLTLFEMAPRTFGEVWAERHVRELVPGIRKSGRDTDPDYSGQYDLWADGIRIEAKASRVVAKRGGGKLAEKALASGSSENFDMNYQQLKPSCCDVFVWVAVWRDKIDYWVLSAREVRNHPLFSNQHRKDGQAADGDVYEGQIHINKGNYNDFEKYRACPENLLEKIRAAAKRN